MLEARVLCIRTAEGRSPGGFTALLSDEYQMRSVYSGCYIIFTNLEHRSQARAR